MAFTTWDNYAAATKQNVSYIKTPGRTSVAASWFTVHDLAGNPGAATLAVGNTANGVVPDDTVAGFPSINAFGGGNTGYLSRVQFGSTVASRMMLYDRLFHAGAFAFNASVSLSAQPSYSARVPSGTDFTGTQIWIECVTAFTGNPSIAVTYTNQAGTVAHTTGTVAFGLAPTLGRMIQLPLQAGDSGVQKIESVTATVATVGTFNVVVVRPLSTFRCRTANDGGIYGPDLTGLVQVFATSAFALAVNADSTSVGIPEVYFEVSNG